ncbi:hypothetical protein [Sporomusa sp.]|uniref:hypothetical protein n=1 Tax=Sporomusa sp. TaxID=2078658 RepID=UPI002BDD4225|nr:hypothetical protein [Sporomusa sp.]HWR44453.1 hypothetical protein [Sporomusa sp.]
MLPIQFALELESSINIYVAGLSDAAATGIAPLIALINSSQKEFLQLLSVASAINIDTAPYPDVNETKLLGSDSSWQQVNQNTAAADVSMTELTTLWAIYTAIDKSIQFYQQAASNSAHPQTRLFYSSLCQVKKILRRRIDGHIQIYYNHYWGHLGFAPFILGKD